MKLSVIILNEASLTGLWARVQQVLILRFAFGAEKFPGLSRLSTLSLLERVPFLASLKMRDLMQVSSKLNGDIYIFLFLAYYAYHPNLSLLEGQFKTEVVTA